MNLPGCGRDFFWEAVVAIGGWSDGGKGRTFLNYFPTIAFSLPFRLPGNPSEPSGNLPELGVFAISGFIVVFLILPRSK